MQKRPPQAPSPDRYPGIYPTYEYRLNKATGVQEIGENMCRVVFYSLYQQKPFKKPSMSSKGTDKKFQS